MANSRYLSYKRRYTISIILVSLCLIFGSALFIAGGVIHSSDIHAKKMHERNLCKDSVSENYINATIEHDGFRIPEAAEDKQNQYQIDMSYSCWCNVDDRSKARWDEPSIIIGIMTLIAADVATILCLVGLCYTYRARRLLKLENEQLSV